MVDMFERVKAAMLVTDTDFESWHPEHVQDALVNAAIEAFAGASTDEIIRTLPIEKLVGIVMRLTGGTTNPSLPRVQALRIRDEQPVGSMVTRNPSGETVSINLVVNDEGELWRREPAVNAVIVQAVEGEPDDFGVPQYMHIVSIECRDFHVLPVLRATARALTTDQKKTPA